MQVSDIHNLFTCAYLEMELALDQFEIICGVKRLFGLYTSRFKTIFEISEKDIFEGFH